MHLSAWIIVAVCEADILRTNSLTWCVWVPRPWMGYEQPFLFYQKYDYNLLLCWEMFFSQISLYRELKVIHCSQDIATNLLDLSTGVEIENRLVISSAVKGNALTFNDKINLWGFIPDFKKKWHDKRSINELGIFLRSFQLSDFHLCQCIYQLISAGLMDWIRFVVFVLTYLFMVFKYK